MTQITAVAPAPSSSTSPLSSKSLLGWVCTSNPFYVLSAGMFLVGLWLSFGAEEHLVQVWGLMSGLTGYTLLLASTACLLVRFGNVWDDVRTVLLLVVLMFLATSVTFDEILVNDFATGVVCSLTGLIFAFVVSEGLLLGIRLRLPVRFHIPYHLILSLFFLYPLALRPFVDEPHGQVLPWGLFAFSSVAGLAFLTLIPAIRQGPDYVRENGSPWRWPLYPWVLFGLLAFAVPARAFLLCWSMHLLAGQHSTDLIFGSYFLVPFGFALSILLFEIGLQGRRQGVVTLAMLAPVTLMMLAAVGHREDAIYQGFLARFSTSLGADPLFMTLLLGLAFYSYASLRGIQPSFEAITLSLILLGTVGRDSLNQGLAHEFLPAPILLAGVLQLGQGIWKRSTWHCLVGGAALLFAGQLLLPQRYQEFPLREGIALHLALALILLLGAVFDDGLARGLRLVGIFLALGGALFVLGAGPGPMPLWVAGAYPLALAVLLLAYGFLLRYRPAQIGSVLILMSWLLSVGWQGYALARQRFVGLDHILISLALFVFAVLVSLAKAGFLDPWLFPWQKEKALSAETCELSPPQEKPENELSSRIQVSGSFTSNDPLTPE